MGVLTTDLGSYLLNTKIMKREVQREQYEGFREYGEHLSWQTSRLASPSQRNLDTWKSGLEVMDLRGQ